MNTQELVQEVMDYVEILRREQVELALSVNADKSLRDELYRYFNECRAKRGALKQAVDSNAKD